MARTLPGGAGERTLLAGGHLNIYAKLEIKDSDGTWRELTNLSGHDWLERWTVEESVDNPSATATFVLRREIGALSLAPLVQASTINRNAAMAYVPLVTAPRLLRFKVAEVAHGVTPVGGDYHQIFQGPIANVDPAESENHVTVRAYDEGYILTKTFIETEDQYSTPGGTAVETVMQAIIDHWITSGAPTVVTPVPSGWNIKTFTQARVTLMQGLRDLALQRGWDFRYMYQAASDTPELRFFGPDRAKTVPDWTFTKDEYLRIPRAPLSDDDVRNAATVDYLDASGVPATTTRLNSASISLFGRRWMLFGEEATSNIDTLGEAQTFGDAAVADLGTPPQEHDIETLLFWPLQLGDLCRFAANSVQYDQDQDLAVFAFKHEGTEPGHAITTIVTRGKPAGAYRDWVRKGKRGETEGVGEPASGPTAEIRYAGRRTRSHEFVTLDGALGQNAFALGPLRWQYAIDNGSWSAESATPLPVALAVPRAAAYSKDLMLRTIQGDDQTDIAVYSVPPRIDDSANGPREDSTRSGIGGLAIRRMRIPTITQYSDDGTRALLDSGLEKVTDDLRAADGFTRIISRYLTQRYAAAAAGAAAEGVFHQSMKKGGMGGVFTSRGNRLETADLYDAGGIASLIDTALSQITTELRTKEDRPIDGSLRYRCKVSKTTSQIISTGWSGLGTGTDLDWQTEIFDHGDMHAINDDVLVIPGDGDVGVWLINVSLWWTGGDTDERVLQIIKNPATTNDLVVTDIRPALVSFDSTQNVTAMVVAAAGDQFVVRVAQFSGADRNVEDDVNANGDRSFFEMFHLF